MTLVKHTFGWRKQLPDPRDYPYKAHIGYKVAPEELPAEVDLSNLLLRVKNQVDLGCCVGEGVTTEFEALQVSRTGTDFEGCVKQVYQNARVIGGYYPGDNGCNIRDGIKATVKYGVAHQNLWPFLPTSDFDAPIKSNVIADALKAESTNYYLLDGANATEKVNNIWNCLAVTKLPVVFGMPVFQQYEEVDSSGLVEMPGLNEQEIGGHCNVIYGRTADGYYKSLNSWNGWGMPIGKFKAGACLLPPDYVKKYVSDCWVVANESEISPLPAKITSASPARTVTSGANTDTFVVGSDGAIYWKRNTAAWLSLSGKTQQIVPPTSNFYPAPEASYINGVLTVDVEGSDGGVWRRTFVSGTTWTDWKEVFLNLN
jgi:hypothetical protein